jgi:quinoprotein glucose dehydrogenase
MSKEEAPTVFGGLLAFLGLVMAIGSLSSGLGAGMTYFIIVGVLLLVTGLLIFAGKSSALIVYGVTLAVVWFWSLRDIGWVMDQLLPRVALPTLLGLYIYSNRIRPRLD